MCGYGKITFEDGAKNGYYDYTGTFFNDKYHGVGTQQWPEFVYDGEYKAGRRHGKATHYYRDGRISNVCYKEGKKFSEDEVVLDPNNAWYKDGKPVQF